MFINDLCTSALEIGVYVVYLSPHPPDNEAERLEEEVYGQRNHQFSPQDQVCQISKTAYRTYQ